MFLQQSRRKEYSISVINNNVWKKYFVFCHIDIDYWRNLTNGSFLIVFNNKFINNIDKNIIRIDIWSILFGYDQTIAMSFRHSIIVTKSFRRYVLLFILLIWCLVFCFLLIIFRRFHRLTNTIISNIQFQSHEQQNKYFLIVSLFTFFGLVNSYSTIMSMNVYRRHIGVLTTFLY